MTSSLPLQRRELTRIHIFLAPKGIINMSRGGNLHFNPGCAANNDVDHLHGVQFLPSLATHRKVFRWKTEVCESSTVQTFAQWAPRKILLLDGRMGSRTLEIGPRPPKLPLPIATPQNHLTCFLFRVALHNLVCSIFL